MSFNGSFGDADFINEVESNNDVSLGQEDIKMNLACGGTNSKKNSGAKVFINNESSIPSNSNYNIFCSVPMEIEIDNNNTTSQNIENNTNNNLSELLSKELIKYNLGNIFNILNNKKSIIKSRVFYFIKNIYKNKINLLLKTQILYMKISSSLEMIIKIFTQHEKYLLYQAFYELKKKYNYYKNNFREEFEKEYKQNRKEIISKNNNDIKSLQDEIKDIKENINQMTEKESKIKEEINNYLKQEKNLNEKIKCIETLNNSMKESIKSSNSSSIKTISKYDNEILSLESALNLGKNLKEKKQKLINKFILNVNSLLNEYQVYIDNLKDINNCNINKHDNNMIIETSNSNLQSLKHKETMENYIFGSKLSE